MKNQRINFLSIIGLILIALTFILSYDYLTNTHYGNFMEMYDNAAHMAMMRGFYKKGIFSLSNYWLYPPAIIPFNYPPLFHFGGAILLNFLSIETISRFYFWTVYLFIMLVVFFTAKKITDVKGAFFTTLLIVSFKELGEKSFGFAPLVCSICWGLLSFMYFRKNKFLAALFLTFSLLSHLNGITYLFGYMFYFLLEIGSFRKTAKSFFKKNKLIKIGAVVCIGVLVVLWAPIFIHRLQFLKPQLRFNLNPFLLVKQHIFFLARMVDPSYTFLAITSILGFIVLLKKKDKLWISLFVTNFISSISIQGRIFASNRLIFPALLTGIFVRELSFYFKKGYPRKLFHIFAGITLLSMVFIPYKDASVLRVPRKSSFVYSLFPQIRERYKLFFPIEERKKACGIIQKLSEIDDLVFVEGSLNTEGFIFAFSGRVANNKVNERLTPLLWLSKTKVPSPFYRRIETFNSGFALYILKDKEKSTKLTTKVIR